MHWQLRDISLGLIFHVVAQFALSSPSYPQNQSPDLTGVRHIVIDVRGSRGGHGDVSAGNLTMLDLIHRHQFLGEVTLIIDELALRILNRLYGRHLHPGNNFVLSGEKARKRTGSTSASVGLAFRK